MNEQKPNNPNDFKVVEVTNPTDFDFTPELGCMFDGNPIYLATGETRQFPYHIGRRISLNLAKQVMLKAQEAMEGKDKDKPIWTSVTLSDQADSFMKVLYSEEKPVKISEHDALIQKMNDLEKLVKETPEKRGEDEVVNKEEYKTKADVIDALTKKEIVHDPKKSKADLEKLLKE